MSVRASEAELERLVQGARRILARRQGDGKRFGAAIDQRARWRRIGAIETIDDGRKR
jgi:hypothetical protein